MADDARGSEAPGDGRAVVLVVDDDAAVGRALQETLEAEFQVHAVTRPDAALAELAQHPVAVLLADQQMPGMGGVELLAETHRLHPDVVSVLITAYANLDTALQAINAARAFAFLTKPWDVDELLVVVRRAVNAHRALRQQRGTLWELQQREIRVMEEMAHSTPAPLTAQRFGAGPVRQRLPETFDDLHRRYAEVLEHAFAQRLYRVDHRVSEDLTLLADQLGALRAGPRDVMDLHITALGQRLERASLEETDAYAEEGRLLVLELMGRLVSYYRAYMLGVSP
jgi:response regulator RpfG family c-di-GMP phosphodiesterase